MKEIKFKQKYLITLTGEAHIVREVKFLAISPNGEYIKIKFLTGEHRSFSTLGISNMQWYDITRVNISDKL